MSSKRAAEAELAVAETRLEAPPENHEARDIAWARLTLALGGLALAAGSVINYAEGKLSTGLTESAMSGGVLLASYLMRRRQRTLPAEEGN